MHWRVTFGDRRAGLRSVSLHWRTLMAHTRSASFRVRISVRCGAQKRAGDERVLSAHTLMVRASAGSPKQPWCEATVPRVRAYCAISEICRSVDWEKQGPVRACHVEGGRVRGACCPGCQRGHGGRAWGWRGGGGGCRCIRRGRCVPPRRRRHGRRRGRRDSRGKRQTVGAQTQINCIVSRIPSHFFASHPSPPPNTKVGYHTQIPGNIPHWGEPKPETVQRTLASAMCALPSCDGQKEAKAGGAFSAMEVTLFCAEGTRENDIPCAMSRANDP